VEATPFSRLAAVDRLIHEPSRLAILSALLGCAEADFRYLLTVTGLTKGNLSAHLAKLEEGGVVAIRKGFAGKTAWTRAGLTADGRAKVEAHWQNLDRLRKEARSWRKPWV
jgi:DNA-binding transcriptional ArsR family regulator